MCGNRTHPPTPVRRGNGFEVRGAHQVPFHSLRRNAEEQSKSIRRRLEMQGISGRLDPLSSQVGRFPPSTAGLTGQPADITDALRNSHLVEA